jgi:hypothetical protein
MFGYRRKYTVVEKGFISQSTVKPGAWFQESSGSSHVRLTCQKCCLQVVLLCQEGMVISVTYSWHNDHCFNMIMASSASFQESLRRSNLRGR